MSTTTQADLQAELKSLRARVAESECERGRSSDVELPQVRELLDLVMAHAPVVLWSVDQDGVFTISQGKGLKVLGLHAGEAVGQSVFDMYRNVPQVITDVRRALAGDEFQSTVKVGKLYFETWFSPIRNASNAVMGVWGVSTEVTDRVRAEAALRERKRVLDALRESEGKWRSLVENSPDYILTATRDGTIQYINRTLPQLTPEDVIGMTVFDFIPEDQHADMRETLERVFKTGESIAHEHSATGPQGTQAWYASRIGPIKHADQVVSLIIVATDITPQKKAEEEARQRQLELEHVSRVSTIDGMASILAHELNNPLAVISNFASGCVRRLQSPTQITNEELVDALQDIADQATRASQTIRRLRNFLGKKGVEKAPTDPNLLVTESVALAAVEARRWNVLITLETAETLPAVLADNIQMQQVLVNLLLNGLEAMQETESAQRRLVVQTALTADNQIYFSVQDAGEGLPHDFENRIFEPFCSTKPQGLGLGLWISRSIVKAHDGSLWATRNEGRGATFHVSLPVWSRAHADE